MFELNVETVFLLGLFVILMVMLGASLLAAHIVAVHRLGDGEF